VVVYMSSKNAAASRYSLGSQTAQDTFNEIIVDGARPQRGSPGLVVGGIPSTTNYEH